MRITVEAIYEAGVLKPLTPLPELPDWRQSQLDAIVTVNLEPGGKAMQRLMPYPQVYTVEEFARLFKLSPEAVRTLIRQGEIAAIRIGRQYRIPQDVVDRYFAQAVPPEERGFGLWKQHPIDSLAYVDRLREGDHRTPETFLQDMAEDG